MNLPVVIVSYLRGARDVVVVVTMAVEVVVDIGKILSMMLLRIHMFAISLV